MRINIFTQPLFHNYGGILQNYALQETLRNLGHEPLTINVPPPYPSKPVWWKNHIKTCINIYGKLSGNYQYPFCNPYKFHVNEHELSFAQREFVKNHIDKVDVSAPLQEEITKQFPAEAWIVGSDQIWRPWCSPNIENAFFDFLANKPEIKKLAYAASFGSDQWEISDELTPVVRRLAQKFDAVSVREDSGVTLCKNFLGVDARWVLDPTMLLDKNQYLSLTNKNDYPEGDYIAAYILDYNKQKGTLLKNIGKETGLPVTMIGRMHKDGFDTIESWIATIANAKYVVTDSFHGTVFSIIFGVPVKILKNPLRGNARLDSLLNAFQITSDDSEFSMLQDYSILDSLKDESIEFLKSNLS